jgi:hypothetical protein
MENLAVFGIGIVISGVWLLFLSYLLSRFVFRNDLPLPRAIKCVAVAVVISWIITLALEVALPRFPFQPFRLIDLVTPALVFLWEWWSFKRHWTDDEDVAELFE